MFTRESGRQWFTGSRCIHSSTRNPLQAPGPSQSVATRLIRKTNIELKLARENRSRTGPEEKQGRASLSSRKLQQTEEVTSIPKVEEGKKEYRLQSRATFIRRILTVSPTRPKGGHHFLRNEQQPIKIHDWHA
jgi:hypothetical protein